MTWNNGIGQEKGYDEFWNDTFLMWELLYEYGFTDEDIHVLFADGEDWLVDWRRYKAELYDLVSVTDDSAFYHDVTDIFTALAEGDSTQGIEAMTEDDFFFCWTFDHGGPDYPPPDSMYVYLCLMKPPPWPPPKGEEPYEIWDTTFARYVDEIPCERRVFWMQQCHSGGFRDDLENDKTVFLSSCDWNELAYRADDTTATCIDTVEEYEEYNEVIYHHGEFNFHTMNSARGETPGEGPIDEDIDGDGFVSMEEVWEWEFDHDSWFHCRYLRPWAKGATPKYLDPGNIGSRTFLNATPIVSGHIIENTVWENDKMVYIRGDVVIDSNVTLAIEPGTTIKYVPEFDAEASGADTNMSELVVQGTLIAQGTASEPIMFTSNAAAPQPGDWYGIRFINSSVDSTCIVDNCYITYAQYGITCDQASPKITNNQIGQCLYGVFCYDSAPVITRNKIILSNSSAIYCSGSPIPNLGDLSNADTTDNGYNEIWGNQLWQVFNDATDTVQAENNWWGQYPPDSSQFSGLVDYSPALEQSSDSTAPAAISDLSIELIKVPPDSGIMLSWSAVTMDIEGALEFISHYVIYRDTTFNFEPTSSESLAMTPDTTFEYFDSEPGVVNDWSVNYYYNVEAVDYGVNKSAVSNMVGEFDMYLSRATKDPFDTTGVDTTGIK